MGLRDALFAVFHPGWMVVGIAVGLGLQVAAGLTGLGLLGGLTGYPVMGALIGAASPGETVLEPGVAAFVLAALNFVVGHVVLSLFGVGLVIAAGYGLIGFVLGLAGGWIGERL